MRTITVIPTNICAALKHFRSFFLVNREMISPIQFSGLKNNKISIRSSEAKQGFRLINLIVSTKNQP